MEENKELNTNPDNESNPSDERFDILGADQEYKNHNYKKKKRGIAAFFQKITTAIADWWRPLKKWKKILISVGTLVIALILVAVILLFTVFDYNYKDITSNPEDLGFENVIDEKIVNIALFGIDTRSTKSFSGNSDSIMVLSINTETNKVKIVSIMRDSLVKVEREEKTSYKKINSAYALGGPELAIKTINQNFGLDISEYATVNFYGMAEIIDAVGGIEVEFTEQEVYTSSSDGFNGLVKRHCKKIGVDPEPYYINTPGKHKVNGIQAVAYSRIRKFVNVWGTNNDFGRTDRQRYVMEQLFNKAIKLEKTKYINLVKALIPYTETSLSYSEIMGLAMDVLLESPTFEQTRMPLDDYQMSAPYIPREGSTVYYDLEFAKNLLHSFFYEDVTPEKYVEKNGISKNDWYAQISGVPSGYDNDSDSSENTSSDAASSEKNPNGDTNSTQSKPQSSKPSQNDGSKPLDNSTVSSSNMQSASEPTQSTDSSSDSSNADSSNIDSSTGSNSSVSSNDSSTVEGSSSSDVTTVPQPPSSQPEDSTSSENSSIQ